MIPLSSDLPNLNDAWAPLPTFTLLLSRSADGFGTVAELQSILDEGGLTDTTVILDLMAPLRAATQCFLDWTVQFSSIDLPSHMGGLPTGEFMTHLWKLGAGALGDDWCAKAAIVGATSLLHMVTGVGSMVITNIRTSGELYTLQQSLAKGHDQLIISSRDSPIPSVGAVTLPAGPAALQAYLASRKETPKDE